MQIKHQLLQKSFSILENVYLRMDLFVCFVFCFLSGISLYLSDKSCTVTKKKSRKSSAILRSSSNYFIAVAGMIVFCKRFCFLYFYGQEVVSLINISLQQLFIFFFYIHGQQQHLNFFCDYMSTFLFILTYYILSVDMCNLFIKDKYVYKPEAMSYIFKAF